MTNIEVKKYSELTSDLVECLSAMEPKIFDAPLSKETIWKELESRHDLVGLVAYEAGIACGYKVGFQQSPDIFYSWIGGVIPEFRRRGIATTLLQEQHRVLKEMGYKYVRTSTKNKYREMLLLNIKSGLDIIGVQKSLREAHHSIILEKEL